MKGKLVLGIIMSIFLCQAILAADIALVVKDADDIDFTHEYKVKRVLESMGLDVELIDKNSGNVDYSQFSVIVIAGRPLNVYSYEFLDEFVADIPVNDYPTVVIDSTYPDDFGWIEPGAVSVIFSKDPKYIPVESDHPIFSGFNIGQKLLTHIVTGHTILNLEISRSRLTPIAAFDNSYNTAVISVGEPGQELFEGESLQSRVVFFGITNPLYWTEEMETLFENSVWWVLADGDEDGILDHRDNCRNIPNPDQLDSDGDGIGNVCDACPQEDSTGHDKNNDGCIDDSDGDGVKDTVDNCPNNYNPDQIDSDSDGIGDECNVLPGESVYMDVDEDGTQESATNQNNLTEDGYEFYKDPNGNTNAIPMDGDNDGFTDFLIRENGYTKYWDPDDEILTPTSRRDNIYYIDIDGDGDFDKLWDQETQEIQGIVERDVDQDSMNEIAKDSDNDGSFDEYTDPDSSTSLLSFEDGDGDGKNDFIIGSLLPEFYWDPDHNILTEIDEKDADNDKDTNFLVDINGDGVYDKIYMENTLYDMPELVIESFSVEPTSLNVGESLQVSATIRNTGGYTANNFTVSFRGINQVLTLGPGESHDVSFTWNDVPEGSHSVGITVDSGNVIMEEDEENNSQSTTINVQTRSSSNVQKWGGKPAFSETEVKVAEFRNFPEQVVITQGKSKQITGQFSNQMTFSVSNISLSISGDGFDQDWVEIEPSLIESVSTGETENITITFTIPENAEIYTYPLTLEGVSNRGGVLRTYDTPINLLIQEMDIGDEENTTTTLPDEENSEDGETDGPSPLSGFIAFVQANTFSLVIGVLLAILLILVIVFRDRLPKIEFRLKETKQKYSYKK
jgi:hypothetical protein